MTYESAMSWFADLIVVWAREQKQYFGLLLIVFVFISRMLFNF